MFLLSSSIEPPLSPVKPSTIMPQKVPPPEPYVLVPVDPSQVRKLNNLWAEKSQHTRKQTCADSKNTVISVKFELSGGL